MQPIFTLLHELDRLYRSDSLEVYETRWQIVAQQIQQVLPGFTIAYAELYNSGIFHLPDGSMHHVLVPQQRS